MRKGARIELELQTIFLTMTRSTKLLSRILVIWIILFHFALPAFAAPPSLEEAKKENITEFYY